MARLQQPSFEGALMRLIALRNLQALATLRDLTQNQLGAIARQLPKCDEETSRILSQVYEYVWYHASDYDPARQTIMPWLMAITETFSLDHN